MASKKQSKVTTPRRGRRRFRELADPVRVSFNIERTSLQRLQAMADEQQLSTSAIVRDLLDDLFRADDFVKAEEPKKGRKTRAKP